MKSEESELQYEDSAIDHEVQKGVNVITTEVENKKEFIEMQNSEKKDAEEKFKLYRKIIEEIQIGEGFFKLANGCEDRLPALLQFSGSTLYVNQVGLNLLNRPMILELIKIFYKSTKLKAGKRHLIQELYGDDFYTKFSERYASNKEQNLVKLIMRARILLKNHFGEQIEAGKWLSYNLLTEEWTLLCQ